MKIDVRFMSSADRPRITGILRDTPEFKPSEVAVAEELIDSYLDDPSGSGYHVLVAEADSGVEGYICFGPTPLTEATWDIYWMAVGREKQGQGIGSALLKSAEKEIREHQGRQAIIETSSTPLYEKTRRFHLGEGYEVICRIPDFYAVGDDKLIMQKRLR
jgi:GNAT superfamily N-acetyltransferase